MTKKPVRQRELARQDVEAAVDHYISEAGFDVALGFIDALQMIYRTIGDFPASGSPRYAHELALPGAWTSWRRRSGRWRCDVG